MVLSCQIYAKARDLAAYQVPGVSSPPALQRYSQTFLGSRPAQQRERFAALVVAVSSSVAASRAFTAADELQRDTDEERNSSQAGMALVRSSRSDDVR
jgi:hypothetical protein